MTPTSAVTYGELSTTSAVAAATSTPSTPTSSATAPRTSTAQSAAAPTSDTAEAGVAVYATIVDLGDGGLLYRYEEPDGSVLEVPVPGPDFDPLTASDGELARYFFPERPSDPGALAEWQEQMSQYRYADMLPDNPLIYHAGRGNSEYRQHGADDE